MNDTKRYWFVNKKVGIGWVPATWEGWLIIVLYVIGMFSLAQAAFSGKETVEEFSIFIIGTFLLLSLLMVICVKFGEPLEWKFWEKKEK